MYMHRVRWGHIGKMGADAVWQGPDKQREIWTQRYEGKMPRVAWSNGIVSHGNARSWHRSFLDPWEEHSLAHPDLIQGLQTWKMTHGLHAAPW